MINDLPPPLGVHHFLADGAGQPVGGVVFAEIVADVAGNYRMIQVFQGIPTVGLPIIAVHFRNYVIQFLRPVIIDGVQ